MHDNLFIVLHNELAVSYFFAFAATGESARWGREREHWAHERERWAREDMQERERQAHERWTLQTLLGAGDDHHHTLLNFLHSFHTALCPKRAKCESSNESLIRSVSPSSSAPQPVPDNHCIPSFLRQQSPTHPRPPSPCPSPLYSSLSLSLSLSLCLFFSLSLSFFRSLSFSHSTSSCYSLSP